MPKQSSAHAQVSTSYDWRSTDSDGLNARPSQTPGGSLRVASDGSEQNFLLERRPLAADRPLGFAQAARQCVDGTMVRCEERYPNDGLHSVLYVVVERDAAKFREKLEALHHEFFDAENSDPLAPVRIEVLDRATDEALKRLIELGLFSRTVRAVRSLFPLEQGTDHTAELSDWERQKAASHREVAARKLKMAALLGEGGLHEEARGALLEAVLPLACALAIEARLPEPGTVQEALLAPLAHRWAEALRPVRQLANDSQSPWEPVLEQMRKI